MSPLLRQYAEALRLALEMFGRGGREREDALLAMLRNGDRVICTAAEAQHIRRYLRGRGMEYGAHGACGGGVKIVADEGARPLFDHHALGVARQPSAVTPAWIEQRLQRAIENEVKAIGRELAIIQGVDLGCPAWPQRNDPPKQDREAEFEARVWYRLWNKLGDEKQLAKPLSKLGEGRFREVLTDALRPDPGERPSFKEYNP